MPIPIIPVSATPGPRLVPKAGADGKLLAGWIPFAAPGAIGSDTPDSIVGTSGRFNSDLTLAGAPGKIKPAANSTSALQVAQADGTAIVTFDTTNKRVGVNKAPDTVLHLLAPDTDYRVATLESDSTIGAAIRLKPTPTGGRNWMLISTANGASSGGGRFGFWDETGGGLALFADNQGFIGMGAGAAALATLERLLHIERALNGTVGMLVRNTNNGTSVAANISVQNATGNGNLDVQVLGTAFTTNGAFAQNTGMLVAGAALAGLNIITRGGSPIRFYTGGISDASNLRLTISSAGLFTFAEGVNFVLGTSTGTKIGTATSQKLGFFNATPVVQPTALTAQLTTITHTAPGTPDYALQNLTNSGGYGFATLDEGNTFLSVVANLQTRVAQLETKLQSLGLVA